MGKRKTRTLVTLCLAICGLTKCHAYPDSTNNGIENLSAIPEFRSVKLKWVLLSAKEAQGFFITLCEMVQIRDSCFERQLLNKKSRSLLGHDSLWTDGSGHYEAVVHDLRMLTNYTVKVELMDTAVFSPMVRMKGAQKIQGYRPNSASTSFVTKGFSAYATNCRSNSSDIVVYTGPYFGGKIAVDERSADPKCSVFGNRSSSQETYVLRINHRLCGSKTVNGSRIDTVVVVHESSSVVTHNSRRFMVQCSFLPDTFTIKASFSIPTDSEEPNGNLNYRQLEEALQNVDSNDVFTYEHYKQNHVKDSRLSSVQGPSVLQKNVSGYESQMLILLVVVIVMVILVVIVIGLGLWWYINSHRRGSNNIDIETLSTSGSSVMAYHHANQETEDEGLVRHPMAHHAIFNDPYSYYHARNMNPFCAGQVALVSLKPMKELY